MEEKKKKEGHKYHTRDWDQLFAKLKLAIKEGKVEPTAQACREYLDVPPTSFDRNLRSHIGISGKLLYRWAIDDLNEKEVKATKLVRDFEETHVIHADGREELNRLLMISAEQSKTKKGIMEAFGYLPEEWDVIKAESRYWNGLQHIDKGGRLLELKHCKLIVGPKKFKWDKDTIDAIIEAHLDNPIKTIQPINVTMSGKCLMFPITDLHLGLHATKEVVGSEYSMEIAEQLVYLALGRVKEIIGDTPLEQIILIVGNDFLNSDNLDGTTSKGTPQDTHEFWFSLVNKALEIISTSIRSLFELGAPVHVYCAHSNHDQHSMYTIMKVIEMEFANNDQVHIDVSPLPRKYHVFGKSVIGISHNMTINRGLELMTMEAKEYWTGCDYFYWFLAHKHKAHIFEPQGHLELYRMPAISGLSRWAKNAGFTQKPPYLQWVLLDKEEGMFGNMKTQLKL